MTGQPDILVIGAGIAGLAAAAELARSARVLVLEAEAQPATHSTGRSAAVSIEPYEHHTVFALTRATRAWLADPPDGFAEGPLTAPRGTLDVVAAGEEHLLDAHMATWQARVPALQRVDRAAALELVPILRDDVVVAGVHDPSVLSLDVHALVLGHQRLLRARGGALVTGARVSRISQGEGVLEVQADGRRWQAPVVVCAAGAWAGEVAALAGSRVAPPVPHRRTAALVAPPPGHAVDAWPLVHVMAGGCYFKPEAGQLMLCAADATPSPPCDAAPDELDVAQAVDRAQQYAHLPVQRVAHRWAGLRTFAADNLPMLGFDPEVPGLFWLAGQGGFGVQTSSALAELTAALVLGRAAPGWVQDLGLDLQGMDPARLLPGNG